MARAFRVMLGLAVVSLVGVLGFHGAASAAALDRSSGAKSGKVAKVAVRAESLERQLENLVAKSQLGPVQLSVCLVDCASGEVLAGVTPRTALMPASNMKLLTSGAALLVLGKDFEYSTRMIRDGDKLVLIGSGDPAFGDPELLKEMKLSPGGFLDRLVESAQKAGVKGVKEVVVDDRIFDRELVHPTWPSDQLHRWYCAEVTGLIFHCNILNIFPVPGPRPGSAPMPAIEPAASWIEIVNHAQTVATGTTKIGAFREADLRFKVTGSIRAAPDVPIDVTLHDTPAMLARLMADRVTEAGMGTPSYRVAQPGERFDDKEVLAVVRTPISTVLRRSNVDSYNLYAEAMLKRIGHDVTGQPGSWGTGATVLRMQIGERIGLENGELVIADGSGMSRENRVSSMAMARWLAALSRSPVGDAFYESLAAPGEGTLAKRFRDRKGLTVRAKSGFINGVQCLSGYVTEGNRRVAFSVLVNNITSQTPGGRVKEFHEEVVHLVDQWLSKSGGAGDPMGG